MKTAQSSQAKRATSPPSIGEPNPIYAPSEVWGNWTAWIAALVVLTIYLWIATAGTWTRWPDLGSLHQKQADAFRRGQAYLLEQPDDRLLALADPYDSTANKDFRLHDASLYRGRYYLYWGPVPAGLLAVAGATLGVGHVKDSVLVFTFTAGTIAFVTALLVHVRRRCFADVPAWTLPLAVLVVGLANPFPYNFGRAAVYEVAITAAAMFTAGGIYFAMRALEPQRAMRPPRAWLLVAGVCLACAVGSRTSTAPVVSAIAGFVLLRVWRDTRGNGDLDGRARRAFLAFIPMLVPLLIAGAGLATYNAVRFGSPFESGIRYQLAGYYGGASYDKLTSAANVVPNLYSYLLRPGDVDDVFPFIFARSGLDAGAFPTGLRPPSFHMAREGTVGVLLASPFVWFAAIPLAGLVWRRRSKVDEPATPDDSRWLVALLVAAVVLGAIPALFVSLSSNRYQTDWMVPLLVLSVIGFWTGWRSLATRRAARRTWTTLGIALACATAAVGILLPVTAGEGHFAINNPALLKRLIESTHFGNTPAVVRVSAPFGIDDADDRRGWWLGQTWTRVDVIAPRDGLYRLEMTATLGPCLAERPSAELGFASSAGGPFDDAVAVRGMVPVPRRDGGFTLAARVPLKAGFSRVYLFTNDTPSHPGGAEMQGCRRMIEIRDLKLSEVDGATTQTAPTSSAAR